MSLPFTASKALKIATGQTGMHENPMGSNKTKYGAAIRLNGQPWCAVFAWWVFLQCGVDIRKTLHLPGVQIAGVAAFERAARKAGWWHTGREGLRAGDLLVFDSTTSSPGNRDHIRFVISAGTKTHKGVGGNESNRVTAGTRDYANVVGYIRPPYAAEKRPHGTKRRAHTVTEGESLSSIAQHYYHDGDRWPEIYRANRHAIGSDPDEINPGMRLVIP